MLASIRRSLLRSPTRPTLAFSMSTTTTTTTTPPTPELPQAAHKTLADIVERYEDESAQPRNTKSWKIFQQGDILRLSDLTPEKCRSSRNLARRSTRTAPSAPEARYNDVFRQLDLDPLDFTLNPYVLSTYISEMGKIYGRNITGLTPRSQRRLGKAIRRARMIGIIPQLSRPSKSWMSTYKRYMGSQ